MTMRTITARARATLPFNVRTDIALFAVAGAVFVVLALIAPSKVVNGLLAGSTIALGAIGITLIYSILGFAHVAHGDYMTMGAYIALFFVGFALPAIGLDGAGLGPFTFGYPLLIALPLAAAVTIAVAIALDIAVYRPLRRRGAGLVMLAMVSLGIAIAVRGAVQMLWGTESRMYPREGRPFYRIDFDLNVFGGSLPFDIRIPPDDIFLGITAVLLVLGLYLFLTFTRTGKAMRATSDNLELARVTGIDTTKVIYWAWGIAAAYAAVAGTLLAVSQAQLLPIIGWKVLIPLFAAVTLGGIGKPWGALAGGLIIGVTMEASTEWASPAYKPAIAFAIMLLALLLMPRGIFGDRNA